MAFHDLFVSALSLVLLQDLPLLVNASPLPQNIDGGSSYPTVTSPGDQPAYPTDPSHGGPATSTTSDSTPNWYYIVPSIGILLLIIGCILINRRRRQIARKHAVNTRTTLQRDLSDLSQNFHGRDRTRGHTSWTRGYGRTVEPTVRRDVDGFRLDHNESGEAPPPYVKEVDDGIGKPMHARTRSVGSEETSIYGVSTPGSRNNAGVELTELSGRLPGYGELDGHPTAPHQVHGADSRETEPRSMI